MLTSPTLLARPKFEALSETLFRVQEFQIAPGAGVDNTAAWANLISLIPQSGARIVFPAGLFEMRDLLLLTGVGTGIGVGQGSHLIIEGQGISTRFVPGAGSSRCLTIDGGGGGRPVTLRDFAIGYLNNLSPVDNDPTQPLLTVRNQTYLRTERLYAFTKGTGTLIRLSNVWNSKDEQSVISSGTGGAVGIEWRTTVTTNQTDTLKFDQTQFSGVTPFIMQANPDGMSTVEFDGIKQTSSLGSAIAYADAELASTANWNTNVLTCVAGQIASAGFVDGDHVFIQDAGNGLIPFTATASGTATLTSVSAFTNFQNGMSVFGTGIPDRTTIVSFNSGAGTMVLSNPVPAGAVTGTVVGANAAYEAGIIVNPGGVNTGANTLTLVKPLQYQHTVPQASGGKLKIIRGGVGIALSDNWQIFNVHDSHFEGFATAILAHGGSAAASLGLTLENNLYSCDRLLTATGSLQHVTVGKTYCAGRFIGSLQNYVVAIPSWNPGIGAHLDHFQMNGPFIPGPFGPASILDGAAGARLATDPAIGGSNTTVSGAGQTFPTGSLVVAAGGTLGFPATGSLNVQGVTGAVAYTGSSGGNTFTGCTGGTGTATNGGAVTNALAGAFGQMSSNQWVAYTAGAGFVSPATDAALSGGLQAMVDRDNRVIFSGTLKNTSGGNIVAGAVIATLPVSPVAARYMNVFSSAGIITIVLGIGGVLRVNSTIANNTWLSLDGCVAPL